MKTADRRREAERRIFPRGGRRASDLASYSPLIFLVTREAEHMRFWEALLLDRRFAVIPCNGAGPALEAFRALKPDVIVAASRDVAMLRDRLPSGRHGTSIPLVEFAGAPDSGDPLVAEIRRALRTTRMSAYDTSDGPTSGVA
jgi:hypothetical protein